MDNEKLNILFVCNGNSFRSQIAEGWAKALKGDQYNFYSAGLQPHGVNPKAIKLMAEVGIDISQQTSDHIDDLGLEFDLIFTVCGDSLDGCVVFEPAQRVVKIDIDAPTKLAKAAASQEEADGHYRRARDDIREFVERLESYL